MSDPKPFLCGVIEGFYGRPWPAETRLAYAEYLQLAGLNTYLYCPKSDPILRKQWPQTWPEAQRSELGALVRTYRDKGLFCGVGLSPFNLYRDYSPKERDKLRNKIGYLEQLEAPLLAILFDDMPGDMDALAARQAEIVNDVSTWLPDVRLLVCPTYYSYDPLLEKHFGQMPADYWSSLGAELTADAEIFWTGNTVCAEAIQAEDVAQINRALGRPVTLWDNYPVNDGPKRSNFLYTKPLPHRSSDLRDVTCGHLCNPMNQGILSLPALGGLSALYGTGVLNEDLLRSVLGNTVWELVVEYGDTFRHQGLSGMGEKQCMQVASKLLGCTTTAAAELRDWLGGDYHFDPACLTD